MRVPTLYAAARGVDPLDRGLADRWRRVWFDAVSAG